MIQELEVTMEKPAFTGLEEAIADWPSLPRPAVGDGSPSTGGSCQKQGTSGNLL